MLTEVLLEVTDIEVKAIAREVYNKARQQASKGIWTSRFVWVHLKGNTRQFEFNIKKYTCCFFDSVFIKTINKMNYVLCFFFT